MDEVIIATKNEGKAAEFKTMLAPLGVKVRTLLDFPEIEDIEETGHTFEENAVLKAEETAFALQKMVIADDSGLSIEYLGGKPGVYSARYAGEQKDDAKNIQKVLQELKGVPHEERSARFHCALAIAAPGQETITVEGTVEGIIAEKPEGMGGFGYDPIFIVKDKGKTMAQLTKEEKNKISHRANALNKLQLLLQHEDSVFRGNKEDR
ncbi:XTP/dITP diphosphatase [Metabacillus arenae]|uniref:dITP/XTP pyrophosphatase n=1 Tax=Metabacillus arenae TaxID=2771434 RepID=A0A926NIH6_9BACI|nr:XTP/dITP diphosphatase [Metabacillus arenae]MBD1381163.1 XTP/dITP diphosphatase [Metabacillus arenae]